MPSGACVITYDGKRGKVFRIKYRDAAGKQQMETVGHERDGWTEKKAEAELRERLVRVERRGWQRPRPLKFSEYADAWFAESETRRRWRPRTIAQYLTVRARFIEAFGGWDPSRGDPAAARRRVRRRRDIGRGFC